MHTIHDLTLHFSAALCNVLGSVVYLTAEVQFYLLGGGAAEVLLDFKLPGNMSSTVL